MKFFDPTPFAMFNRSIRGQGKQGREQYFVPLTACRSMIFAATLESGYRSAMMAGMLARRLAKLTGLRQRGLSLFESSLAEKT